MGRKNIILIFALLSRFVEAKEKYRKLDIEISPDYGYVIRDEINIYRLGTYNNISIEHTTKTDWNFALYFMNLPMNDNSNQSNISMLSIGKNFRFDYNMVSVGFQIGTNLMSKQKQLYQFSYVMDTITYENLEVGFGVYYVNQQLANKIQPIGGIVTIEYNINDSIELQINWLSGTNQLSGTVVNLGYQITDKFEILFGVILPMPYSQNAFSGSVGFEYRF